jgi:hypothetical protein
MQRDRAPKKLFSQPPDVMQHGQQDINVTVCGTIAESDIQAFEKPRKSHL